MRYKGYINRNIKVPRLHKTTLMCKCHLINPFEMFILDTYPIQFYFTNLLLKKRLKERKI